jgi:hypothetical protein
MIKGIGNEESGHKKATSASEWHDDHRLALAALQNQAVGLPPAGAGVAAGFTSAGAWASAMCL